MSNGKVMIVHVIAGLIKRPSVILLIVCIKMTQYFPKPYEPFGRDINVDLTNYATKTGIKNISHVDTSNFASKSNLAGLETEN